MQDRQVGSDSFDKPFVSFCLMCYNQEKYIAQALAGTFRQTYDNMEIVISDDGSTDGSVEIIKREIAKYRESGGKLPVMLNINEKNLGVLRHWHKIGTIAKGELLIKADGDDISLPERTAKIVEAWVRGKRKTKILQHRGIYFTDDGASWGLTGQPTARATLGGFSAYSKDCWTAFPEFPPFKTHTGDDPVFAVRALALGGTDGTIMSEPLVFCRLNQGITSAWKGARNHALLQRIMWKTSLEIALDELKDKWDALPAANRQIAKDFASHEIAVSGTLITLLDGKKLKDRLSAFKKLKTSGAKAFLFKCIYLLPNRPKSWLLELWDRVKKRRILRSNGEKITDFTKVPARYA